MRYTDPPFGQRQRRQSISGLGCTPGLLIVCRGSSRVLIFSIIAGFAPGKLNVYKCCKFTRRVSNVIVQKIVDILKCPTMKMGLKVVTGILIHAPHPCTAHSRWLTHLSCIRWSGLGTGSMHNIAAQVTHSLLWCRESRWTPPIDHKKCIGCGVQRLSAWYSKGSGSTGLHSRCMPCTALYDRQRLKGVWQAWDSKDSITSKMCRGCYLTLPADSFAADPTIKDGYRSRCRDCIQVEVIARRKERLERSRNQTTVFVKGTERICTCCRVEKPYAEFCECIYSTSGIQSSCKQCANTKQN